MFDFAASTQAALSSMLAMNYQDAFERLVLGLFERVEKELQQAGADEAGFDSAHVKQAVKAAGQTVTPKVLATPKTSCVKLRSCDEELKPEAIMVLEETPEAYKLLVLSDGMCDGGLLAFTIAR